MFVLLIGIVVGTAASIVDDPGVARSAWALKAHSASRPMVVASGLPSAEAAAVVTTTTIPRQQPPPTPVAAPVVTVPAPPSIAALVAQAESAGIQPGPHWSWYVGDTTVHCGSIAPSGVATGCTSWSSGVEQTVFAGSPSLPLVAHEVANAETESSATPGLLSQVAGVEAGTSWSATDAVASCLVAHFLGFQDNAAGSWQCPATLAAFVADHIHDPVLTTQTTAVCGTTSGIASTLSFAAGTGSLAVTQPSTGSLPLTSSAGGSVTVSGIGTFTAVDTGGSVTVTGICQA
jgi:hypothetical protein